MFRDKHRMLGLTISYYRKIKGYTQAELAEQAGISRTHLSNIEAYNTEIGVSLDTVFKIADALEIPVQVLFEKC